MTGACQYAARLRHHGKDVPGLAQVLGLCARRYGRLDSLCAIVCRDTGCDALGGLDRYREVCCMVFIGLADHQRKAQLLAALARQRQAYQATAVRRHIIDVLRPHLLGRHDQVTFVLTVLVVDHDDHLAGSDIGDDVIDAAERSLNCTRMRCGLFRHNHAPSGNPTKFRRHHC